MKTPSARLVTDTGTTSTAILVASAMALVLSMAATPKASAADDEQCFGIVKAGQNDCKAGSHSCKGMSTMDADPASFVLLPAGTCTKIAGGSLKPKG